MSRLCKRAVLLSLIALPLLYLSWGGGWRDLTAGRMHRKAHDLFSDTDGLTEVRLYLIKGKKEQRTGVLFPIRPYGAEAPVCGEKFLKGEALNDFLSLWRRQTPSWGLQGLCHSPVYGVRLYRGASLAGETSLCWHCNNYWVQVFPGVHAWYGFDAQSKDGQNLLSFCDQQLPFERDPPSPAPATR